MLREEDRRALKVLHGALCIGCVSFLLVLVFLNNSNGAALDPAPTILVPLGLGSLLLIVPSFLLFHRRMERMRSMPEPIAALRASLIMHWALIESTCFVNAVMFLLTGSWLAFGAAVFAVGVLVLRMPTDPRVDTWLTGVRR